MRKQRKSLRQVVDSDLAASYGEEDSYPLQGYRKPARPFIPPAAHNSSGGHHNDPLRLAIAVPVVMFTMIIAGIIIANWHAVAVYGIYALLAACVVGVGVVILLAVGKHQRGAADTDPHAKASH